MGKTDKPYRKPQCPACGSTQVRHVRTTGEYYCRKCPWTGDSPDIKRVPRRNAE